MASLSGCAGYNTTVFTTKSNVGLDIDTKPPTAEITVSRKEAVVEPAFEGGKTPPVMASFKPHVGFGSSLQNFFVGVDQTFAGGDAAVILSKLYDKPDASFDQSTEDSTLLLSEPPKYKNFFQRVPGPGESRPLVFTTDTILGLKIVWSGTSGQLPDSIKAGFNRKEFAWAPLNMTTQSTGGKTQTLVSIPPFLATIESHISGDTGKNGTNEIAALQYFATGEAARQLALKRDVRAAMLARLDPNTTSQKARFGKLVDQPGDVGLRAQIVLTHVYNGLAQMANGNDNQAKIHVKSLDDLGKLAHALTWYDDSTPVLTEKSLNAPGAINFQAFRVYQSMLQGSINALTHTLASPPFQYQPSGAANPIQVTPNSNEARQLEVILRLQQQLNDDLSAQLRDNTAAAAAIKYYCQQLSE